VALVVAVALTRIATFEIGEVLKPQEVRTWEAGKEVWFRPLPMSVAKNIAAQIERERRERDIEAREPRGSEWEFALGGFVASFVDPIALAILVVLTFVMLKLLPRERAKNG
jgi:hypothetical protein